MVGNTDRQGYSTCNNFRKRVCLRKNTHVFLFLFNPFTAFASAFLSIMSIRGK